MPHTAIVPANTPSPPAEPAPQSAPGPSAPSAHTHCLVRMPGNGRRASDWDARSQSGAHRRTPWRRSAHVRPGDFRPGRHRRWLRRPSPHWSSRCSATASAAPPWRAAHPSPCRSPPRSAALAERDPAPDPVRPDSRRGDVCPVSSHCSSNSRKRLVSGYPRISLIERFGT